MKERARNRISESMTKCVISLVKSEHEMPDTMLSSTEVNKKDHDNISVALEVE